MKVEPNDYLKSLTQDTVITCGKDTELYKLRTICSGLESIFNLKKWCLFGNQVGSFEEVIEGHITSNGLSINSKIFDEGIECEVLDTNFTEWKKGKFRAKLVLEFIPDEPEVKQYSDPKRIVKKHRTFSDQGG